MSNRVQSTNDNSSVSKASMVNYGYFEDKFAKIFVDKLTRRSPLINRGYFIRAHAINNVISLFLETFNQKNLKSQIVSLGSGYDSTYFRLKDSKIFKEENTYIEIDFLDLQNRKLEIIKKYNELQSLINFDNNLKSHHNIILNSVDYKLIGFDLRNIKDIFHILSNCDIDPQKPTLVLSEVVLAYLAPKFSNDVIQWAAHTFNQCLFVSYEQICPNDGFGKIMCNHFSSIGSPLLSIHNYPTAKSQIQRYKNLGWSDANCSNMNDYYSCSVLEKYSIEGLELFDEWEEWTLMCSHYIILLASNHIITQQFLTKYFNYKIYDDEKDILINDKSKFKMTTNIQNVLENIENNLICSNPVILDPFNEKLNLNVQRYGHSSTLFNLNDINSSRKNERNKGILILGGFGKNTKGHHSRLNFFNILHLNENVWKVNLYEIEKNGQAQNNLLNGYETQASTSTLLSSASIFSSKEKCIDLSLMHHTCNYIGNGKFLIVGGRESPSKPLGMFCLHLFDVVDYNTQIQEIQMEMSPRWRHSASLINFFGTESLLIFGGCNLHCKYLDEFWIISELSCKKIEYFKVPGRHSHTMNRWGENKIVICGGVAGINIKLLADIFVLDFKEFTSQKVKLVTGEFIPRYSHTADIVGNSLIVFGGVTTYSQSQPMLTIVDLQRFTSVDLLIKLPETLVPFDFFKHTMVALFDEPRKEENSLFADTPKPITNFENQNTNAEIFAEKYFEYLIVGGGGNCFSFGTLLNKFSFTLKIDKASLNYLS